MKILLVLMLMFSTLFSAETIHGKMNNSSCYKGMDDAQQYSAKPSKKDIQSALGCQKFIETGSGGENCRPCPTLGQYKCQGFVTAYCDSDEAREKEKNKEAKPEVVDPEKLSQEEWEKAEFARIIKEEQERIKAKEEIEKLLKDEEINKEQEEPSKDEESEIEQPAIDKEEQAKDEEKEVADEYEKLMVEEKSLNVQRIVKAQESLRRVERKEEEETRKKDEAHKKAQKRVAVKPKNKAVKSKKLKKVSRGKKYFLVSKSTCQNNGGNWKTGILVTKYAGCITSPKVQNPDKICKVEHAKLPSMAQLESAVKSCGGTVVKGEDTAKKRVKNYKSASYQSCMKNLGFATNQSVTWTSSRNGSKWWYFSAKYGRFQTDTGGWPKLFYCTQ